MKRQRSGHRRCTSSHRRRLRRLGVRRFDVDDGVREIENFFLLGLVMMTARERERESLISFVIYFNFNLFCFFNYF